MKKLIVLTAPSGAGKTTIVRHLLKKYNHLAFSISATTRPRRTTEIDGKDYYFISKEAFQTKIANGDFLEWEEVYSGVLYGTLREEVERLWANGKRVVFDMDVKGALNIKRIYEQECCTIFIQPPSFEILIDRLTKRKTEDASSLKKRIAKIKEELKYSNSFDYCIINDELEVTFQEAEAIIENLA